MKPPRRFYSEVAVSIGNDILLDGKPVKTPGKRLLNLPTAALAEAVAAEWRAQGEKIDPATMIMTKLANTALDRVIPERGRIIAEMVEFAGSDLVCYRAVSPDELIEMQAKLWDAVIDWALAHLDARFTVTEGVTHKRQPVSALKAIETHFAAIEPFPLTAIHNMMTLTGSALLAAMTAAGGITPEAAWQAAHADEDFQIQQWGEDEEAAERRERRRQEFIACARFAELAGCPLSLHHRP